MVQCWCHAAMAGWLGALAAEKQASSLARMRRWQYECERAGGDCAARVEAIALRMPFARAVRCGPVLRLHASNGSVEFVDGLGETPTEHRYLGLLAAGQQHLVWTRGAEGARFVTVADHDGRQAAFATLEQSLAPFAAGLAPACERDAFTA